MVAYKNTKLCSCAKLVQLFAQLKSALTVSKTVFLDKVVQLCKKYRSFIKVVQNLKNKGYTILLYISYYIYKREKLHNCTSMGYLSLNQLVRVVQGLHNFCISAQVL